MQTPNNYYTTNFYNFQPFQNIVYTALEQNLALADHLLKQRAICLNFGADALKTTLFAKMLKKFFQTVYI